MSMRLLPKEPIMLRDTSAQDRVIEPKNIFKRHRKLVLIGLVGMAALGVLVIFMVRYSGAAISVDRARVSIAAVERGNFVRDIAADGQVVAAVSPTLYANALGTVALKVSIEGGNILTEPAVNDCANGVLKGTTKPQRENTKLHFAFGIRALQVLL